MHQAHFIPTKSKKKILNVFYNLKILMLFYMLAAQTQVPAEFRLRYCVILYTFEYFFISIS